MTYWKKVLVTGGRNFNDVTTVHWALDQLAPCFIITGGASGADRLAEAWAESKGTPCAVVRPWWSAHGKKAGPMRNSWMLDLMPDIVIAFPGGRGTESMKSLAREAGVTIVEVTPNDHP